MNKDVIKQLILLHQSNIPFPLSEREEHLPLHVEQIITIPGVRRSGKSSKMKLLINALVKSGVSPQNILWMGFDDERLDEQQTTQLRLAWDDYNRYGGFPEVVLTQDQLLRDKLLQTYYQAMLFRDMVERHHISNVGVLRYFIRRIMNNVSKPTSINSIYNDIRSQGLKVSKDELYKWAEHLCESFMFIRIPRYTSSLIAEETGLKKYYFIDNGMRQNILLPHSQDDGKLLESSVLLHLCRRCGELEKVTYFMKEKECDFVLQHEEQVLQLIQVCWQLDDAETREREIAGLLEAHQVTHCDNLRIITHHQEETILRNGLTIQVAPVWKWMLSK